jgi:hypothetical protein
MVREELLGEEPQCALKLLSGTLTDDAELADGMTILYWTYDSPH